MWFGLLGKIYVRLIRLGYFLRCQVSHLYKKENPVSVIVKQEATIKLLASPVSQPFLPSLPRVNSTRGYCSSIAASPSQS